MHEPSSKTVTDAFRLLQGARGERMADDPTALWCRSDDLWFRKHPRRRHRIRKPYPGELEAWGVEAATAIIVRRFSDGSSIKFPLNWPDRAPPADDEAELRFYFDAIVRLCREPAAGVA
jgi:hypothetical protein